MATEPVGPASGISLQLVTAVIWTSSRVGPPAQGGEVTSVVAVVTFAPNGRTAHLRVGTTTVGALGLLR